MKSLFRGKFLIYTFCTVFTVCFPAFAIGISVVANNAQNDLRTELKLDSKLGIPTSPAEATRYLAVPDSENSYSAYHGIFKKWVPLHPIYQRLSKEAEKKAWMIAQKNHIPAKAVDRDQVNKESSLLFVKENQANLKKLPIALTKPYFVGAKNWEKPYEVTFPEYTNFRSISEVLKIQCENNAKSNPEVSVDKLNKLITMANQLSMKSVTISGLVQASLDSMAIFCGRTILTENQNRPEIISKVLEDIQRLKSPSFELSIPVRIYSIVYFITHASRQNILAEFPQNNESVPIWIHFTWSRNEVAAKINKLDRTELQVFRSNPNNFPLVSKKIRVLENTFANNNMDLQQFMPYFLDCVQAGFQTLRDQRILILTCKVDLDHLKNHQIPSSLRQYGEYSENPMINEPFIYQQLGSSVKIISQISQPKPAKNNTQLTEKLDHIRLNFGSR